MIAAGTAVSLVDERRAAEVERKASLFEQTPGFVMIVRGPQRVVEYVYSEHCRLFDSGTWQGKPIRTALPEVADHGFVDLMEQVYGTGVTQTRPAPISFRHLETGQEKRETSIVSMRLFSIKAV